MSSQQHSFHKGCYATTTLLDIIDNIKACLNRTKPMEMSTGRYWSQPCLWQHHPEIVSSGLPFRQADTWQILRLLVQAGLCAVSYSLQPLHACPSHDHLHWQGQHHGQDLWQAKSRSWPVKQLFQEQEPYHLPKLSHWLLFSPPHLIEQMRHRNYYLHWQCEPQSRPIRFLE